MDSSANELPSMDTPADGNGSGSEFCDVDTTKPSRYARVAWFTVGRNMILSRPNSLDKATIETRVLRRLPFSLNPLSLDVVLFVFVWRTEQYFNRRMCLSVGVLDGTDTLGPGLARSCLRTESFSCFFRSTSFDLVLQVGGFFVAI